MKSTSSHNQETAVDWSTPVRPDTTEAKELYLESLLLIERLHRRFLDVIKVELERLGVKDVNNVQSLILYNIGESEMTVGDLTSRGYYLGSNVSYNLKKLVENGYLVQHRSPYDRRSVHIRLSPKGLDLYGRINALYDEQVAAVGAGVIDAPELTRLNETLHKLETFWTNQIRYGSR